MPLAGVMSVQDGKMGLFKKKAEKELEIKFNELVSLGRIKDKTLSKYEAILDGYKEKLKGYSHKDQKPYWH